MCRGVVLPSGKRFDTQGELGEFCTLVMREGTTFSSDVCLCPVDLEKTAEKAGYRADFTTDSFDVLFIPKEEKGDGGVCISNRKCEPGRKTLNEWAKEIHMNAVAHGWYNEPRSFGDIVALCHSELSEALEEYRSRNPFVYEGEHGKPEGTAVEMADCLIRILDWFASEKLDVEKIVLNKHTYNSTRPYRHGGKAL